MLSNNLLFAAQERKHEIYQDQLHRLVLLDEPELATTLKHLLFTVKTCPQELLTALEQGDPDALYSLPSWLTDAISANHGQLPDEYTRLGLLISHVVQSGLLELKGTYCGMVQKPQVDLERLSATLQPFYPQHFTFLYSSLDLRNAASCMDSMELPPPEQRYISLEEAPLIQQAWQQQLPEVATNRHLTAEAFAEVVKAHHVLALRRTDGTPYGVVVFNITGASLHIEALFKIPQAPEKQVLFKLVDLAKAEALALKCTKIFLYYNKAAPKVGALYAQAGFVRDPRVDQHYFLPA